MNFETIYQVSTFQRLCVCAGFKVCKKGVVSVCVAYGCYDVFWYHICNDFLDVGLSRNRLPNPLMLGKIKSRQARKIYLRLWRRRRFIICWIATIAALDNGQCRWLIRVGNVRKNAPWRVPYGVRCVESDQIKGWEAVNRGLISSVLQWVVYPDARRRCPLSVFKE